MTDNERHNKQGSFTEQMENAMAALDYRIKNPPRPISGQAMIAAIMAHEEENRGRFHLSTYSFVAGIRFAERRMGIAIEDESNDG